MATPAQITANRANAHFSTGPRSVEGKAASSRNSLKLGLTAQSLIIPGEDPAEFDQFIAGHEQKFQPVGPVEEELETLSRIQANRRNAEAQAPAGIGAPAPPLPNRVRSENPPRPPACPAAPPEINLALRL